MEGAQQTVNNLQSISSKIDGGKGSVGIWHETSTVAPGQYVSANRPRSGLAAAAHLPATGRLDTARSRIGRSKPAEDPTEQP